MSGQSNRKHKNFESKQSFELHVTLEVSCHVKGFMYKKTTAWSGRNYYTTCTYRTWNLSSMSWSSCCVKCSLFSSSVLSAKSLDTCRLVSKQNPSLLESQFLKPSVFWPPNNLNQKYVSPSQSNTASLPPISQSIQFFNPIFISLPFPYIMPHNAIRLLSWSAMWQISMENLKKYESLSCYKFQINLLHTTA